MPKSKLSSKRLTPLMSEALNHLSASGSTCSPYGYILDSQRMYIASIKSATLGALIDRKFVLRVTDSIGADWRITDLGLDAIGKPREPDTALEWLYATVAANHAWRELRDGDQLQNPEGEEDRLTIAWQRWINAPRPGDAHYIPF